MLFSAGGTIGAIQAANSVYKLSRKNEETQNKLEVAKLITGITSVALSSFMLIKTLRTLSV